MGIYNPSGVASPTFTGTVTFPDGSTWTSSGITMASGKTAALLVTTATSLALGGATIGSNALAVTGTSSLPFVTTGASGASKTVFGMTSNGSNYGGIQVEATAGTGAWSLSYNTVATSALGTAALTWNGSGQVSIPTSLALGGATIGTDALGVTGSASISGALKLATGQVLSWNGDTGISRSAAGILIAGNGTAGDASGQFKAATLLATGNVTSGSAFVFASSSTMFPGAADGTITFTKSSQVIGALLDFTTDAVVKLRNRANNADAAITAGAATFTGQIIQPGGAVYALQSAASFNNAAGGSVGTLTNAPAAGNPTKWIYINDNGTVRAIPAW